MMIHASTIIAATLLTLQSSAVAASEMVCTQPDELDQRSYKISEDHGIYIWGDHGVERSWSLKCDKQQDGSTACHRWEQYGEKGKSVIIFRMLPDGTLIEAGSWAMLDVSIVRVTPGFVCTTQSD